MDPKTTFKTFGYANAVRWSSGRRGFTSAPGRPEVEISSPPEFRGDPGYWTPEDLFVASVNACTMLTFLTYAHREGLDLLVYDCSAEGTLEHTAEGYRFTGVTLHANIAVKTEDDVDLARAVLDSAHMGCLVTRSMKCAVKVVPNIRVG